MMCSITKLPQILLETVTILFDLHSKAQVVSRIYKMSKPTNFRQFDALVGYMEAHPDVAKGYLNNVGAREKAKVHWRRITEELNCLGPPCHDIDSWKKVWADYKQNIKKKIRKNKANMQKTGGGPSKNIQLTPTEQKVYELLNLQEGVYGSKKTKTFGVNLKKCSEQPVISSEERDIRVTKLWEEIIVPPHLTVQGEVAVSDADYDGTCEVVEAVPNPTIITTAITSDDDGRNEFMPSSRKRNKSSTNKENAFQKQIQLQSNFFEKCITVLKDIKDTNTQLVKAVEELSQLIKQTMHETEKYRHEKLKLRYEDMKTNRRKIFLKEEMLKLSSNSS